MGMTITEKILAKAAGKPSVIPGENVWVNGRLSICLVPYKENLFQVLNDVQTGDANPV